MWIYWVMESKRMVFSTIPTEKSQLWAKSPKIKFVGPKIGFQHLKLQKNLTPKNEHYLALSLIVIETWAIF